jgi:hypothetical protein
LIARPTPLKPSLKGYAMTTQQMNYRLAAHHARKLARLRVFMTPDHEKRNCEARCLLQAYRSIMRLKWASLAHS